MNGNDYIDIAYNNQNYTSRVQPIPFPDLDQLASNQHQLRRSNDNHDKDSKDINQLLIKTQTAHHKGELEMDEAVIKILHSTDDVNSSLYNSKKDVNPVEDL